MIFVVKDFDILRREQCNYPPLLCYTLLHQGLSATLGDTSMVAATNNGANKTAFVTGVLQKNPKANPVLVNAAWKESGRTGSISGTLVHKIRAELGLAGNLRARSKSSSADKKAKAAKSTLGAPVTTTAKIAARPTSAPAQTEAHSNGSHANTLTAKKTGSTDRDHVLESVEGDIDRLIFSLMGVGGLHDIEEALRRVRRLVVLRLEK